MEIKLAETMAQVFMRMVVLVSQVPGVKIVARSHQRCTLINVIRSVNASGFT